MRVPAELLAKLEGRVIEGKFPLQQRLGGSDHSAAFLTERSGEPHKAAIKLTPSEGIDEDSQLSRWADAAKLSHPHVIRLFECGRCEIDGTRFLYVVMEFADEDLAQILPLRPLLPVEVTEMLPPTAEALAFLHRSGFAHGHIKPSNVMAVDNQLKISADGLRKIGEPGDAGDTGTYTAPEVATVGVSPAADVWSVGIMLVTVLTQREPMSSNGNRGQVAIPETIPEPFRKIARQCLRADPKQRCSVGDILSQFQTDLVATGEQGSVEQEPANAHLVEERLPEKRSTNKRWIIVPIAVALLVIAALIGSRFIGHTPQAPPAQSEPAESQPASSDAPAMRSQAPVPEKVKPTKNAVERGSVLQQVMPEVSRSARNTITGRVKLDVRVVVDASGNVTQATLKSDVKSKYFANLALGAARRWKFNPPQMNGQATASEWLLRFQFGRASTQVFPSETKPPR
ncbi:MAG: TonB family protein [Candidatus Sulfotelmatobacter sp.]